MFAEVGINADVQRICDTRNEVIHTGLYGNVHNDDTFDYLHSTLREYFLHFFNGISRTVRPLRRRFTRSNGHLRVCDSCLD